MKSLFATMGIVMAVTGGIAIALILFLTPVVGMLVTFFVVVCLTEEIGWDGPESLPIFLIAVSSQIYLSLLIVSHMN